ncbi:REP-associated tyrosine transposase [Marinobacterium nitratireducens]|nr:transposase [Marinobacterium nitratireducens]
MGRVQRTYHGRDLRKGRVSEPGTAYLVTTVTRNRQALFRDLQSARILVRSLRAESDNATTLAFVVMPDHLHWLLQLIDGVTLSGLMQRVKSASAHHINRHLQLSGAVWQSGFHDHAVRTEEDLRQLARYVVANPLRAGLVSKVGDYSHWDAIWL